MSAPGLPPVFDAFCAQVTGEMRHLPARRSVTAELAAHLEDHAAALVKKGVPEEEAEAQSVAAMGDPVALGQALDKVHSPLWHRVAKGLTICAVCLFLALVVLNNSNVGSYIETLIDHLAPPPNPATEAWYYSGTVTPLRTGGAQGHAWLGDYRYSAAGDAALVRETVEGEDPFLMVRFPLSTFHWQPWLKEPSSYAASCQAWDDLGNVYPLVDYDSNTRNGCMIQGPNDFMMTIFEPDPAATAFTVRLTAANGDTAVFTVTLDKEVTAP